MPKPKRRKVKIIETYEKSDYWGCVFTLLFASIFLYGFLIFYLFIFFKGNILKPGVNFLDALKTFSLASSLLLNLIYILVVAYYLQEVKEVKKEKIVEIENVNK